MKGKKYLVLFLLTTSVNVYNLVYLPTVFYVPFQKAFMLTNQQMGNLMSMYALLEIPFYLIGGWLTDRFSPKILLVISSISSGMLGLWMSTYPSYSMLLFIFFMFSITVSLLTWTQLIKCIRVLGDESEQGKLFGTYDAYYGLFSAVISYGVLYIFKGTFETRDGFKNIILFYSIFSIIVGILIAIFYDYKKYSVQRLTDDNEKDKVKGSYIIQVVKMPITWINGGIIYGAYTVAGVISYLNPYLNKVYLLPAVWATVLGIALRYVMRMIGGPVGGLIRDKMGKSSTLIRFSSVVGIMLTIIIMLFPRKPELWVFSLILVLLLSFVSRLSSNCLYTPIAEGKVPIKMAGTMIGVSSAIGYSPALYLYKICGFFLDKHGVNGYNDLFIIMIIGFVISVISAFFLDRFMRKINNGELKGIANVEAKGEA